MKKNFFESFWKIGAENCRKELLVITLLPNNETNEEWWLVGWVGVVHFISADLSSYPHVFFCFL
jgi:protein tyrosine phosphatase